MLKTGNLGKVLATPARFGIYYWTVEKKAGGKIRCTGQCAVAWPPVYVRGTVQKHVKGVAATFGTIKRGTKRQLTINGLPAYTYHHDPAGVVLCDDVNGWFAVRPLCREDVAALRRQQSSRRTTATARARGSGRRRSSARSA